MACGMTLGGVAQTAAGAASEHHFLEYDSGFCDDLLGTVLIDDS